MTEHITIDEAAKLPEEVWDKLQAIKPPVDDAERIWSYAWQHIMRMALWETETRQEGDKFVHIFRLKIPIFPEKKTE